MREYLEKLVFSQELPPTIAVSEDEVLFLHGNLLSISIQEDNPYTLEIMLKGSEYYECTGNQAIKLLNTFPEHFFHNAKNLLKMRSLQDY